MRTLRAVVITAGLLTVTLAGCGGGEPSTSPRDQLLQPTATPTVQATLIDAPADYHDVTGSGFTIAAPAEFQEQRQTSSNGEPMLVLENPSRTAELLERVAVIRDTAPKSPVLDQSYVLESAKSAFSGGLGVERLEIEVPGDQQAYLVTWTEQRTSDGRQVGLQFWQLMWQTSPDLIFNVVAMAPADEFATSEVSKMLLTFRPEAA